MFTINDNKVIPTFTSIKNEFYYFTKSGKIPRTSVSIDLSSFVAVSKLRVTFLYFKDWSFREYSDTLICIKKDTVISCEHRLLYDEK